MSGAILKAQGLFKSYGKIEVLKEIDIELQPGESHVVIGPNGAGKTTLFKCLSGETQVNAGSITMGGRDITGMPGYRRVQRGVGRTFQVARVFQDMTVSENLTVAVEMRRQIANGPFRRMFTLAPAVEVTGEVDELIDELRLGRTRSDPARILSHGDKKRLELAMCLALRPRILMLDEPTAGMSPADRAEAVAMISRVRDRHGLTLLLTEHDMEVVFGLATRLSVLHHGALIATGAPAAVREDPRVKEVYLGHT